MNMLPSESTPASNSAEISLPASIKSLFTEFMKQCATKHFDDAEKTFSQLYPLLGNEELLTLFSSLLNGTDVQQKSDDIFLIGNNDKVTAEQILALVLCVSNVAKLLVTHPPTVLVNLTETPKSPPFAIRLCNGSGVIYLPTYHMSSDVIAHEVTHCIVATGHHFFDEAIAYFVESTISHSFPEFSDDLPSLRQCFQLRDIHQLEGVEPVLVDAYYHKGVKFISLLFDLSSGEKIISFYQQLPLMLARKTLEIDFQNYFKIDIDECEKLMNSQESNTLSAGEDIVEMSNKLSLAYFSGGLNTVEKLLPVLLKQEVGANKQVVMAMIRGIFSHLNYEKNSDPALKIKLLALVDHIQKITPKSAEYYASAILAQCIHIAEAKSYIEIQEVSSVINQLFDEGLALFPEDGELNLMKGKSLFDLPTAHGGDPILAQQYFKSAQKDPVFGRSIQTLVASLQ